MERLQKMLQLRGKGFSYATIGKMFNLSRTRVHQIISGYSSKNHSELKQIIFQRDNYKCQWGEACQGKNISRYDLVVHHIDFDDRNNDPSNLITLCRYCHTKFHSNHHIDKEREKIIQQRRETVRQRKKEEERKIKIRGIRNQILFEAWGKHKAEWEKVEIGEAMKIEKNNTYAILKTFEN